MSMLIMYVKCPQNKKNKKVNHVINMIKYLNDSPILINLK